MSEYCRQILEEDSALHKNLNFMEWLDSEFWEIKCAEDKNAFYECFAVVTKKKDIKICHEHEM